MKYHNLKSYPNCFSYHQHGIKYGYRFTKSDPAGNRRKYSKRGFNSVVACQRAFLKRRALVKIGFKHHRQITLAQYIRVFIKAKKLHCKPTTWHEYRSIFRNYVIPYLGDVPVKELTRQMFDTRCMIPLVKHGLRNRTLASIANRVSTILNDAMINNVIDKNPLYKYHAPKGRPNLAKRVMSNSELAQFNRVLDQRPLVDRTAFYTLEETGMRIGELLGLQWKDLDYPRGLIYIRHTRDGYGLRKPKTANSRRKVCLTSGLKSLYYQYQKLTKAKPRQLIFRNSKGRLIANSTLSRKLKQILIQAGLSKLVGRFSCHQFRHLFASTLISHGNDIIRVSKYLGHSSPEVTMKIYANYIPGTQINFGNVFKSEIKPKNRQKR